MRVTVGQREQRVELFPRLHSARETFELLKEVPMLSSSSLHGDLSNYALATLFAVVLPLFKGIYFRYLFEHCKANAARETAGPFGQANSWTYIYCVAAASFWEKMQEKLENFGALFQRCTSF